MINIHPTLYSLLLEVLVVFILLTCILSFFQIKHYLQRKKVLFNLVSRLKNNSVQRKEALFRLLKEQGSTDEEQLEIISREIIQNETVFYQYIVHALINIDLNQLSDLDKHVEVLINSTTKTNLANKVGANRDIEKIASEISELHTTVQEIREGQFQLMDVMAHPSVAVSGSAVKTDNTPKEIIPSETGEEALPDSSPSDTENDEIEALEMDFDNFDEESEIASEANEENTEPLEKPEEPKTTEITDEALPDTNIVETNDSIDDLLSEVQTENTSTRSLENKTNIEPENEDVECADVNPDDIIDNINTQPDSSDKKETSTKKSKPEEITPATENDIDAILEAELSSTETDPEESLGIDIDALIEEVADENKSVLTEKSESEAKKEKPDSDAEKIVNELNNIEPAQAKETTHQGMEGATGLAAELEELLK